MILDSDDSGQNADISKSIDNIKKSDFIITVLKDRISILEQQLVEKKCNNRFLFVKQKISLIATYSDINDSSRSRNNRHSAKNNPQTD